MAASVNPAPTTLAGYPGQAGGKQVRVLNIAGSSAYVRGTGEKVVIPQTRSGDFVAGGFPPGRRSSCDVCSSDLGKQVRVLNIAGSSAYVRGTGQTVVIPQTRSVDFVAGAFSQSGNYIVLGQPIAVGNGYKKWLACWVLES